VKEGVECTSCISCCRIFLVNEELGFLSAMSVSECNTDHSVHVNCYDVPFGMLVDSLA